MVRFFRCHFLQSPRRVCGVILAFDLLIGVLLGSISSGLAEPVLFQLMRTAAESRVSIVCLLPVLLLPVVFSAFAVCFGHFWPLIPVAFTKAFCFGYLCSGVLIQYPYSGPLFVVLFLFADVVSLPVLCWLWIRCIRGREAGLRAVAPSALLLLGISIINDQLISPFLAGLLS